MKKIVISSLCALMLTACGSAPHMPQQHNSMLMQKGYEGPPRSDSGFYENSSSVVGQDFDSIVEDTVFFAFDSRALSRKTLMVLDAQIAFMKDNKDIKIVIEGHTDNRGTREYNLALGNRRAAVVRDYLVENGINPSDIKNISYGKERPLVPGSSPAARAKNRRAVTIVM